MEDVQAELAALGLHLRGRREAILQAWQLAIKRDPKLTTGEALPRIQLLDHIPSMLATFERALHAPVNDAADTVQEAGQQPAAAHGLQRWRQGYDLREVTRGGVLIESNLYDSEITQICDISLRGATGEVLPRLGYQCENVLPFERDRRALRVVLVVTAG